jgi:KDO2-lipid IV(A) lauroyltransferase
MSLPSASYVRRVGSAVANALPNAVATPIAEATGRAVAVVPILSSRRRIVRRNLQRATGGAWKAGPGTRGVGHLASYRRYWLELFRLPTDARGSVEERVTSVGFQHITDGLALGKGVIRRCRISEASTSPPRGWPAGASRPR